MRYTIKDKVTKYKQNIVCWRDVSAWPGQWRSFIRANQYIFEISPFIFQSLNEWIFIIEKQKACVVCRREVTGWARQTRGRSTTWEEVGFYHCCSNTPTPHPVHICPPSNIWFHHFQATTCSDSFELNITTWQQFASYFLFRYHKRHHKFLPVYFQSVFVL